MHSVDLEIFEQTSTYSEMRLFDGSGTPRTRGLDKAAVDELIETVDRVYDERSAAQKVFGSSQLVNVGTQLLAFLDGDDRWLTSPLNQAGGSVLRIAAEDRLRHLPWELLARDGSYLTVAGRAPVLPVRTLGDRSAVRAPLVPANRPLRVLFMATSPEDVEPVLNYEGEEAAILSATSRTGIELIVEESGTLEGLRTLCLDYGENYFDVLHLSGHARIIGEEQPVFLTEDEFGGLVTVTAEKIAEAMSGHWPRVTFVSGCLTGNAPDGGAVPSLSESLVDHGAPTVLGWALPVGDVSATRFAAHLYRSLAGGEPIDRAVIEARRDVYTQQNRTWHLLRVYADHSPLAPLVTPLRTKGRSRARRGSADQQFLDPQTQVSRVASRTTFVGRRRVIQRCLRTLQQSQGSSGAAQALVLQGMGGLGKSSLASRLLERMPDHRRAVWYGRVDMVKFREFTSKIDFPDLQDQIKATELLDNEQAPLVVRLRHLLDGPLGETPCLFVFDDFEDGNLDPRDGTHVLSSDMADILSALLAAIRDTDSLSRVIVTSRYRFPAPAGTTIKFESLETFTAVEQAKKLANLPSLRPDSSLDPTTRDRAIEAAAGNPRLLDWLDLVVADTALDIDGLLTAVGNEADRFRRETILATHLLDTQDPELQKMLARVNVVELPIPAETVHAMHDYPDVRQHVTRAVQLGLLEEGTDPETGQPRYFVSNVLRPLLRPLISDDEYVDACAAAARSLHRLWVTNAETNTAS